MKIIEGLKATIDGDELRDLCSKRAQYHTERAETLEYQLPTLDALATPITSSTKIKSHKFQADELAFIATHIDLSASYILGPEDLVKLGIAQNRW